MRNVTCMRWPLIDALVIIKVSLQHHYLNSIRRNNPLRYHMKKYHMYLSGTNKMPLVVHQIFTELFWSIWNSLNLFSFLIFLLPVRTGCIVFLLPVIKIKLLKPRVKSILNLFQLKISDLTFQTSVLNGKNRFLLPVVKIKVWGVKWRWNGFKFKLIWVKNKLRPSSL